MPRAIRDRLPWRWLALGCLLPDLIDKPIWLAARWLGVDWPNFESARMLGHTAFLALAVALAARLSKGRPLVALTWAIPTHLALDVVTDWGRGAGLGTWKIWLFWPFELPRLHLLMASSPMGELARELRIPVNLYAELIGAGLLLWDWRRLRVDRIRP